MVSKPVTSVSRVNRPEVESIGPLMREAGLYKITTVKELQPEAAGDVHVFGFDDACRVEYVQGASKHEASVAVHELNGALTCSYCTLDKPIVWCQHIHHVIAHRYDRKLVSCSDSLLVPVIPSEGVFAPVRRYDARPGYEHLVIPLRCLDDGDVEEVEIGVAKAGAYGYREIRAMFIDTFVGIRHRPDLFHQTESTPFASPRGAYERRVAELNARISPVAQMFYQANWGKSFGELELLAQSADDAPRF